MSARNGGQDGLLKDLRKQVTLLEDDLRARSESVEEYRDRLTGEYTRAYAADRTAATYESWRDERVTQVAAAWVLGCVFVRFCEDNGLIERAWLAGVGERLKDAEDHDAAFFAAKPEKNDRDWIVAAFEHLAGTNPTVAGLFDRRHNPLWEIAPSYEAATALLKFWRRVDSDGELIHSFVDDDLDTRFLGDLYQDLSEHARKTYALLQTPVFVEEFILDLTLEPAVEEFGLEPVVKIRDGHGVDRELPAGLRTIDPACGSGHFLLGLFERLLAKWRDEDKSADDWTLIRRALNAVHGCDKNPFAVSIARFRLLIAALKAAGARRLDTAPGFPINVAVGDSLIHGRGAPRRESEAMFSLSGETLETFFYRPEDIGEYAERCDLMTRDTYHVVVGNPPYITVKDKQENLNYRVYESCSGKYALSVPFAERLFQLAVRTSGSDRDAGFVGQITANSFMKREFGKKLIEEFFRLKVHLTHIIDTSGAYIPGHGTPAVILVGRNYVPRPDERIRAALGVRGEPSQPKDAAEGLVWKAIVGQLHRPGSESEWISVTEAGRDNFSSYPWSLSGGGAGGVVAALEKMPATLGRRIGGTIGFHVVLGDDDVYVANEVPPTWKQLNAPYKSFTTGDGVRDWRASSSVALWPYKDKAADNSLQDNQLFWPYRTGLRNGLAFGKTREQRGMSWHEHTMLSWPRTASPLLITFACVSTHNHFVLSKDHRLHNRHAPVIKLPEGSSESEHLELMAVLNSSAACFWLKQVCHNKGNEGYQSGIKTEMWERFYEFTGTKLQEFPLPVQLPLSLGRALDTLAQKLATHEPYAVCAADEPPTRARLDAAREEGADSPAHDRAPRGA
ncbi:hypothetical protein GCM10010289_49900 [Streptomyces violascens]|uniref:site-specific DNA-methyltransferase (adenine-specific) n=1 Tax=Streptomyces violascens TaxID=67381 RepID=A0ABQ3QYI9_9ACTN|nr:BREX-2 system adenine-specific DNA-methyltransferase PglX [Streptomyces violascens]GGU22416.1 hypothetical protein GCM10010289_49900 [Streptomyces violascens]GHI42345.1 hypothetical protein Sviol_67530 [Streptomyces violascens]